MDEHFRYCAARVHEADRDRYLAALFAPADKREALFALYAFDIEISRARAVAREPMPGEIRLQWWHEALMGERAGEAAANPIAAAVLATTLRHNLPVAGLVDFIEAHRFDLYDEPMADLSALWSYSLKTAGTVFEYAMRILDAQMTAAPGGIVAQAAQAKTLANIMAHLPEHAARRQLFIPVKLLRHYGANPDDVFALRATSELRAALAELRLRSRRHLAGIASNFEKISNDVWPAFLSLAPLWPWLRAMEQPAYDPFRPPQLAPWRRQWRIWRAAKSLRRIAG